MSAGEPPAQEPGGPAEDQPASVVVSAGGVVYARHGDQVWIALIEDHRGRLAIPKGKRERGESLEETALREIWEEAGIEGRIVCPLGTARYRYHHSRQGRVEKEVHYFLVEKATDAANPNSDCDLGLRWFDAERADDILSAPGFRANGKILLKALEALGLPAPERVPRA